MRTNKWENGAIRVAKTKKKKSIDNETLWNYYYDI